ncbi:MAG: hypothetical protein WBA22_12245 [Candidatus Methanofastidiosia archaeon]
MFASLIQPGVVDLFRAKPGDCNSDGGTPSGDCNSSGGTPAACLQ